MDDLGPNPDDTSIKSKNTDGATPVAPAKGSNDKNGDDENAADEDVRISKIIDTSKKIATAIEQRIWHFLKARSFTDWIVCIATAVIAVATWGTYVEVQQGGKQTDKIIKAANQIQDALETANIRNSRAFRQTLEQSREAMTASNSQSAVALNATIAQFRLDQRAWVGIGDVNTLDFEVGKNARFDVEIRNTGKTPATNVFLCGLPFSPEGQDPCPSDRHIASPDTTHLSINLLMPNSVNHQWVGTIYPLLKSDFERKIGMRLVGTIWYDDAFQVHHWVRFCRYYDGQDSRFEACEDHNDTDQSSTNYK